MTILLTSTIWSQAQQINPVPDYVFRNQMSVGRNAVTDTGAYFSIGPRYGAVKGFMPPIVGDTASVNANKRNGLLIFSVQKNKFLYWDSVRVQWSDMAGSSGSYITGKGITGYVPQYTDTATLDTSALYTLGNQLGIGTSSFAYTGSGRTVVELNGTTGGLYGFKRNDSAKGYLFHNGDNMELANTVAGSISFNTNSATRGSIASDGVWRLNNLAGTGDRVVVASSNGTLSAASSATGLVDTLTISTRAWRQKGDDSLGAIIATKGNGTVTSVATGYGLSGGTITTTGTLLVDTLNIATRAWRQKGLDSLAALEVSGSGTTNYIPKFTASGTIGNSQIQDNGSGVGIGVNPDSNLKLYVRPNSTTGTAIYSDNGANSGFVVKYNGAITNIGNDFNAPLALFTNDTERLRIFANGRIGVNTTTDAGYQFDIAGNLRTTTGANFATTSGEVMVGTTTLPFSGGKLHVAGNISMTGASGANRYLILGDANASFTGALNMQAGGGSGGWGGGVTMYGHSHATYPGGVWIGRSDGSAGPIMFGNGGIGPVNEQMRLTPGGALLIGGQTNPGGGDILGVYGQNSSFVRNSTDGFAHSLDFYKSRGTAASPTDVANGDGGIQLRSVFYSGGYKFFNAFSADVDGTYTSGQSPPTRLRFWTNTANGSSTERMRIDAVGNVGIGVTPNAWTRKALQNGSFSMANVSNVGFLTANAFWDGAYKYINTGAAQALEINNGNEFRFLTAASGTSGTAITFTQAMTLNAASELLVNTTSDAGDYKLQVVGNARIGTGKLDIASNTTFGLGVARSGTSQVAGQIYNSNGILYLGAESSAGGQIFTGSSAYAAVIGSGANYPLQFATNNATRATINTNGELLINTLTDDGDFKLQVNGNALISGSIKTANGGSSTAVPWHLGSVVATSVQLDTANYVEVEINGTFYRLAIVTPL